MAAKMQNDAPDPPTIEPPPVDPLTDPPLDETLEAKARRFEADNIELRAQLAIHDKANAERLIAAMALDNPDRNFQLLSEACFLVGLHTDSGRKKAWGWLRRKLIYGYKIPGTCHGKVCVNDLRDKVNRAGRHG